MKDKPNKPRTAEQRWQDAIEPLIEEVRGRRGMMARVCSILDKQKHGFPRSTVERWLNRKRKNRVEPSAGKATVLLEAIELARKEMNDENETRPAANGASD